MYVYVCVHACMYVYVCVHACMYAYVHKGCMGALDFTAITKYHDHSRSDLCVCMYVCMYVCVFCLWLHI